MEAGILQPLAKPHNRHIEGTIAEHSCSNHAAQPVSSGQHVSLRRCLMSELRRQSRCVLGKSGAFVIEVKTFRIYGLVSTARRCSKLKGRDGRGGAPKKPHQEAS